MTRVAINGFGRIGRATFKILFERGDLELVAVNDLVPVDNLVYLLRYDTVYGRYWKNVETDEQGDIAVDGAKVRVIAEPDPKKLPWADLDVDIVFECTGRFASKEGLEQHLEAGARTAIASAPIKDKSVPTIVFGANQPDGPTSILSTASCTTNCITPIVEVIGRRIGVKKALMTTTHAYTASQAMVDSPKKKIRMGRSGAQNIIPTTTGAAVATTLVLPQYEGRFHGSALRVPVPVGSVSDITFVTERSTNVDEVNRILREEADTDRYREVIGVARDELVSSDVIGDSRASVVDPFMTQVVDGDLVKVMSWYDNEWGYSNQMVRTAAWMASNDAIPARRQAVTV